MQGCRLVSQRYHHQFYIVWLNFPHTLIADDREYMEIDGSLINFPIFGLHISGDQLKPLGSVVLDKRILFLNLPFLNSCGDSLQFFRQFVRRLAIDSHVFAVSIFDTLAVEFQPFHILILRFFRSCH